MTNLKKLFAISGSLFVLMLASVMPASAGLLRLGYHYGVKPVAHHVKHCGPKVLKGAGKAAVKVLY